MTSSTVTAAARPCSTRKPAPEPCCGNLWYAAGQRSAKLSAAMKPRCTAKMWSSTTPKHRVKSTGSMFMWRTIITGISTATAAVSAYAAITMKRRCTATVQTAGKRVRFLCRSSRTFCPMALFRLRQTAPVIPRTTPRMTSL